MKKFIFFCILTFLIYGCSKQKTIDELINSANESKVNYAIDEIWRLNKTEYTINLVNLLTNEKYKIKAAFALSFLNSETIDKIIYNNLNKNLKNADGFLFYFFLFYLYNYAFLQFYLLFSILSTPLKVIFRPRVFFLFYIYNKFFY